MKGSGVNFIKNKWRGAENIKPILGGEMSKVYGFKYKQQNLIVRLNPTDYGFNKDKLFYDKYSHTVPMPKILEVGMVRKNLYYSVSEYVEGERFDKADTQNKLNSLDSYFEVLNTTHKLEPLGKGYGRIKLDGAGSKKSWKDKFIQSHPSPNNWVKAAKEFEIIREVDYLKKLNEKLLEQTEHLPELRNVVHADYGGNNLFIKNNKVVGVIDWCEAVYGDPLYDIAWVDYWNQVKEIDYKKEYTKRIGETDKFEIRINTYQIYVALSVLYFFAERGQKGSYDWCIKNTRDKVKV